MFEAFYKLATIIIIITVVFAVRMTAIGFLLKMTESVGIDLVLRMTESVGIDFVLRMTESVGTDFV